MGLGAWGRQPGSADTLSTTPYWPITCFSRDYRSKSAALALVRDLKVAFNDGLLTEDEFLEQRALAMADLRMQ